MCCAKPQPPDEIRYVQEGSRSTAGGIGGLLVVALACCGAPLLLIALASGALTLSAVLAGVAGLTLAGAAFLLLRPLMRRRARGSLPGPAAAEVEPSAATAPAAPGAIAEEAASEGAAAEIPEPRVPAAAR